MASVWTLNKFQPLAPLIKKRFKDQSSAPVLKEDSTLKIALVTFPVLSPKTIVVIMDEMKINDFNIKLMSIGRRLPLKTLVDYENAT